MSPTTSPTRLLPPRSIVGRLLADDRGATAIEYGLLAALMAAVIIGGLQALGGETGSLYVVLETIGAAIQAALDG